MRLIAETFEELGTYLATADSFESAAALASQRLHEAAEVIATAMAGYDSLDVAEAMAFLTLFADPETFSEADHEGNLGALELVMLIAGSRTVLEQAGSPGTPSAEGPPNMPLIRATADAALEAGLFRNQFLIAEDTHPTAELSSRLTTQEANLRSTSYPHMVRDTLHALLDAPEIDVDLDAVAGFNARELLAVVDELGAIRNAGWNARRRTALELAFQGGDVQQEPTAERLFVAQAALWANPSEVAVLDSASIAAVTDVAVERVNTILDFFTSDVSHLDVDTLTEQFFGGVNPLRLRPILRHPSGRLYLTNDALIVPAVRERVEEAFKTATNRSFDRYVRRRGVVIEAAALELLRSIFPSSEVRGSFKYFVPKDDTERVPGKYSARVEGDGLLLIDDVALVLEVKSGALSNSARTGDVASLRDNLTKLLTAAADQADRTRARITEDRGLRLGDGSWLDLSRVREIHTIVVTLEDLGGLTALTDDLVTAGVLPQVLLPLTISLHDLRVIAELVQRPAEFLLYLRRRTLPELTRQFLAPDELDLYMHMLQQGLYVEPDPDRLAAEVPHHTVTVAERRRFKAQTPQWLTTRTGPLDAWYFYRLGQRQTTAPQPQLQGDARLQALVDRVTEGAEPGWLAISTALLSCSRATQHAFAGYAASLAAKTRSDGRPHTVTNVFGDRAQTTIILTFATAPAAVGASLERWRVSAGRYITAKKHQLQLIRGAVLLFDTDGNYLESVFRNTRPQPDSALDADVIALGLRPVDQMNASQASMTAARKAARRRR